FQRLEQQLLGSEKQRQALSFPQRSLGKSRLWVGFPAFAPVHDVGTRRPPLNISRNKCSREEWCRAAVGNPQFGFVSSPSLDCRRFWAASRTIRFMITLAAPVCF